MKVKQSYEYTGSGQFTYDNVLLSSNGIALFDQITGLGGIGYVPYNGSTVTLKAGDPSSEYLDFEPGLNNSIYYLVSDQEYTEKDSATIKSLGTEIPVYFNGTDFEGQFVFNNPNDYENLYLMWDYEDDIGTGTASYNGISKERSIALNLGSDVGIAGISHQVIDEPTRFQIEWGGSVISDTGYIGLNSTANYNALIAAGVSDSDINLQKPLDGLVNNGTGQLLFDKFSSTDDARVIVDSPLASSIWIVNRVSPSLKSFYIDRTDGTEADVCTQCPDTVYYHNGSGVLPTLNDRIYTSSDGSTLFDGNNALHMIDSVICTVPSSTGKSYVGVDTSGNVVSINPCDCFEYAVPFIYQEDITINSLNPVSIPISVLGNPTSFDLVTSCSEYSLTGGTQSTLYTYTDCNSRSITITVSALQSRVVCSSVTPTKVRGDGTVSTGSPCTSHVFPEGLTFNDGLISGRSVKELSFSFTINATNCFGTSSDTTINVNIISPSDRKPFLMDIQHFTTESSDACTITPVSGIIFTRMYFDGINPVPELRDRIFSYSEQNGFEPFIGGDKWYFVDNSQDVIRIDSSGYVSDVYACPGTTTTTTSTTTTTIPTVGNYYDARTCSSPATDVVLLDTTLAAIVPGNVVKSPDGNCFLITGTTTGSYPYYLIENPVVIYADCTSCTGTTTTTTTTTTTRAPVISGFSMDPSAQSSDFNACSLTPSLSTYYHNGSGSIPAVNDFVYTDALGANLFDGVFKWYYVDDGGTAYTIHISHTGQVLNVRACAGVTTTTTTTTLPVNYYTFTDCNDVPVIGKAFLAGDTVLAVGTLFKGLYGGIYECYKVSGTTTPGGPLLVEITFIYNSCFDCQKTLP